MTPLLRRILREWRALVVPLAAAAVVNLVAYVLVVYPLSRRVGDASSAQQRRSASSRRRSGSTRRRARCSRARNARTWSCGSSTARCCPTTSRARGASRYARLAQLAKDADLRYERRSYEPDANYDGSLQKVQITMVLEGEYRNVRASSTISKPRRSSSSSRTSRWPRAPTPDAPLTLTLQLATYFRAEGHGG